MVNTKTCYNYALNTGEYIGLQVAYESPAKKGTYLLPAHATWTPPLETTSGFVSVWKDNQWNLVEDHRGSIIWLDYETSTILNLLGPIPKGWSLQKPQKPVTKEDLLDLTYQCKKNVAYGYILIVKDSQSYKFMLDQETSQANIALQKIDFDDQKDTDTVYWKVYLNQTGESTLLLLTKKEFNQLFKFGKQIMNEAFAIQGEYNTKIYALTEEQINNKKYTTKLINQISQKFKNINIQIEM